MFHYNKMIKKPFELLSDWQIDFIDRGKEYVMKCIFSECDTQSFKAGHLFMNADTGQYFCHKCGAKGNLVTMAKFLGKDVKRLYRDKELVKKEWIYE